MVSQLAMAAPKIAGIGALAHAKQALVVYAAAPGFVKKIVDPVLTKVVSPKELKALCADPNKLDQMATDKVVDIAKAFKDAMTKDGFKKVLDKVPSLNGVLDQSKAVLDSAVERGSKLLESTKEMVGLKGKLEKAGTIKKGEKVKDVKATVKNKKSKKKSGEKEPGFLKRMWKKSPVMTAVGGLAGVGILLKVVVPAIKLGLLGGLGFLGIRKAKGLFAGKTPAEPQFNPADLAAVPEEGIAEKAKKGVSGMLAGNAATGEEGAAQKLVDVAHENIKKSLPIPLPESATKGVANKLKQWLPGYNKPS